MSIARPKQPFSFASLTDRDGFTLAPGSFYDWEVGGALYSGSRIVINPSYSSLPGNVVQVNGASYVLPAYTPLLVAGAPLNRERFIINGQSIAFWFVIQNAGAVVTTVTAPVNWTLSAFTLDPGMTTMIWALDNGTGVSAFKLGMTTVAGSVTSVGPGVPAPPTGASELVFSPNPITGVGTIALSTTPVTPGNYGSNVVVGAFTVDQQGRLTDAQDIPIASITVNGTAPIAVAGSPVSVGGAITVSHNNSGVVAGSYGASTTVATFTVNATGHITLAGNATIPSITINVSGPITVSGSPVSVGGAITLTNTALNSIATRNWAAGSSTTIGGGATDSVVIGDSAFVGHLSVAIGSDAGNTNISDGVVIGRNAFAGSTVGSSTALVVIGAETCRATSGTPDSLTVVGYNAGSNISGDQNTFIGAISGSVTTSGTGNTSCGYGSGPSAATTANSTALGNNATTSANNTVALGANVANSTADTALIGDSTAYIVRSAGYFRSAVVYSTKAGRTSGTQTVTFPGPVTLTIGSTQWDNREGGSSNVSGNTILMPQVGRQYLVTAFFRTSAVTGAAIGHAVYRLKVDDNGTVTTIGESTVTTAAATTTEVAAGVSGQYITVNANAFCYSELERISGTTTSFTVDFYGLCSTRLA